MWSSPFLSHEAAAGKLCALIESVINEGMKAANRFTVCIFSINQNEPTFSFQYVRDRTISATVCRKYMEIQIINKHRTQSRMVWTSADTVLARSAAGSACARPAPDIRYGMLKNEKVKRARMRRASPFSFQLLYSL
jgi:hypothetical protein